MMNARTVALEILRRAEANGAYVDALLGHRMRALGLRSKDQAFCRELVLGTMRWRGQLDWVLVQCLQRNLEGLTVPIRNLLRLGTYQILFSDGVPDRATVYESAPSSRRTDRRACQAVGDWDRSNCCDGCAEASP